MPLSRLFSAAFLGISALPIEIEVDLNYEQKGTIRLAGLPDAAVRESKDRVIHAIKNSGYATDTINCMVHLAPAELKKEGAYYDLAIALGILHGLGAFDSQDLKEYLIGGELSLAGELRPICGALSLTLLAKKLGKKGVIIPYQNFEEASLVPNIKVIALKNLKQGILFFKKGIIPQLPSAKTVFHTTPASIDMSSIKGQTHAKRAIEIAAAGQHNVLMQGPPGTGKTMLAKAFMGILPELTLEEALEVTNIHTMAGTAKGIVKSRPFRAPHHSTSFVGMVGGSSNPKPGELSLAHRGVLFLDELPEFSRSTLEALRQPLEDKEVTVSRANGKATFPTDVILIAAMNPCPCGYLGHPEKPCTDSQTQIDRYSQKISGPLLDRIDIHLEMPPIPYHEMMSDKQEESSDQIRERVKTALARQKAQRLKSSLNSACQALMQEAYKTMGISARAHNKIIKVAQTIAYLDHRDGIVEEHLLEALSYAKSS